MLALPARYGGALVKIVQHAGQRVDVGAVGYLVVGGNRSGAMYFRGAPQPNWVSFSSVVALAIPKSTR